MNKIKIPSSIMGDVEDLFNRKAPADLKLKVTMTRSSAFILAGLAIQEERERCARIVELACELRREPTQEEIDKLTINGPRPAFHSTVIGHSITVAKQIREQGHD
jgi:hypothetical protein